MKRTRDTACRVAAAVLLALTAACGSGPSSADPTQRFDGYLECVQYVGDEYRHGYLWLDLELVTDDVASLRDALQAGNLGSDPPPMMVADAPDTPSLGAGALWWWEEAKHYFEHFEETAAEAASACASDPATVVGIWGLVQDARETLIEPMAAVMAEIEDAQHAPEIRAPEIRAPEIRGYP